MFDEKVLQCFLDNQSEEAEAFLEDCMAVVVDSVREVWGFFDEEGVDLEGVDEDSILESEEVFEIGDGRYLIVEG